MLSLKEGTDNRMLVLESLMREIGGDKMKGLVQDVSNLQSDTVALWKENARMVTRQQNYPVCFLLRTHGHIGAGARDPGACAPARRPAGAARQGRERPRGSADPDRPFHTERAPRRDAGDPPVSRSARRARTHGPHDWRACSHGDPVATDPCVLCGRQGTGRGQRGSLHSCR